MARIFALWTVKRAESYHKLKDNVIDDGGTLSMKEQQQMYLL